MSTKLLAVDDSRTMRQVLEHTFAGEDFETVTVEGGAQALEVVARGGVRVALIDVALGDTDGYSVCRSIRERSPQTGVLILSSKQHPYDEELGQAAGASGTVIKPFDTQALIDRMTEFAKQQPVALGDSILPPADSAPPESIEEAELEEIGTELAVDASGTGLEVVEDDDLVPESAPRVLSSQPPPKPETVPPPNGAGATMAQPVGQITPQKLGQLGLTAEQAAAVIALTREVVEQAVWEVVPDLAETLIKEEIKRLTRG